MSPTHVFRITPVPTQPVSPSLARYAFEAIPIHPDHCLDLPTFCASEMSALDTAQALPTGEVVDTASPSLDGNLPSANLHSPGLPFSQSRAFSLASSTSSSPSSSSSVFDFFPCESPVMTEDSPPFSEVSTSTDLNSCPETPSSPSSCAQRDLIDGLWSPASPFAPSAGSLSRDERASRRAQLPYARPPTNFVPTTSAAAAAMQRSYSMPAETQQQVEDRLSHRALLQMAISQQAAPSMARAPLTNRLPLQAAFGAGWGAALPLRSPDVSTPDSLPYPYNLARYGPTSPAPPRFLRSYSTTDIPTVYCPVESSLHMMPSSKQVITPAQKARKVLAPLTPILTSSGTVQPTPRLNRGLSY